MKFNLMASPSSQKTREWLPGRGNNCSWEEAWRAQRPWLLCFWPGTHLFPGLWLWPPVSQGFDPLKSQSSRGRRQDHQSSYVSGCPEYLQLPCSSSSACSEGAVTYKGHLRSSDFAHQSFIMSAWLGIACKVAGTSSTEDPGKGSGSLG